MSLGARSPSSSSHPSVALSAACPPLTSSQAPCPSLPTFPTVASLTKGRKPARTRTESWIQLLISTRHHLHPASHTPHLLRCQRLQPRLPSTLNLFYFPSPFPSFDKFLSIPFFTIFLTSSTSPSPDPPSFSGYHTSSPRHLFPPFPPFPSPYRVFPGSADLLYTLSQPLPSLSPLAFLLPSSLHQSSVHLLVPFFQKPPSLPASPSLFVLFWSSPPYPAPAPDHLLNLSFFLESGQRSCFEASMD